MHGIRRPFHCHPVSRAAALSLAAFAFTTAGANETSPVAPDDVTLHVSPLRLSGFATLGVVDTHVDSPWEYRRDLMQPSGPHGSVRTRVDSRLGVQANLALSSRLDAVTQVVIKPMADGASNGQRVEWALLSWRPANDWTVRMGRLSMDMRLVSEYTNVGFAYPWARPSPEIYGLMSLTFIDGVDLQKAWTSGDARWQAKLQGGQMHVKVPTPMGTQPMKGRDMVGARLQREEGGLLLKASFTFSRFEFGSEADSQPLVDVLDGVRQAPVPSVSAEAAELRRRLLVGESNSRSVAVGLQYQSGTWIVHSELAAAEVQQTGTSDISGFASLGRRIGAVTVFGAAGAVWPRQHAVDAPTDWASALTPIFGAEGAAGSQAVGAVVASIANVTRIDQRSLSLGMRWDVHPQMALKAQVDHIRVGANGAGLWADATSDARVANVFSLVFDTVF